MFQFRVSARRLFAARLLSCAACCIALIFIAFADDYVHAEENEGEQIVTNSDDFDGDEVSDIVTADPSADKVEVATGGAGGDTYTMQGKAGDQFGYSVAILDDGDDNGIKDLLVGAPFAGDGKAFLFSSTFEVEPYSAIPAADADMIFISPDPVDYEFGERVAPVSDLDGDEIQDIRIRAWFNEAGGIENTHTYIISSVTGLGLYTLTGTDPFDPWEEVEGDVDGDGDVDDADIDIITKSIQDPPQGPGPRDGDVNGDGVVDAADLALAQGNFGTDIFIPLRIYSNPGDCGSGINGIGSPSICCNQNPPPPANCCPDPPLNATVECRQLRCPGGGCFVDIHDAVQLHVADEIATFGATTFPPNGDVWWEILNGQERVQVQNGGLQADTLELLLIEPGPVEIKVHWFNCYACSDLKSFYIGWPGDMDADYVSDDCELATGTNPLDPTDPGNALLDYDLDGLSYVQEVCEFDTNPNLFDTDGDSMPDGWELDLGLNPLNSGDGGIDSDGDGIPNNLEYLYGSDPFDDQSGADPNRDTDGDGFEDWLETHGGSDPNSAASTPNLQLSSLLINYAERNSIVQDINGIFRVCVGDSFSVHAPSGPQSWHVLRGNDLIEIEYTSDGCYSDRWEALSPGTVVILVKLPAIPYIGFVRVEIEENCAPPCEFDLLAGDGSELPQTVCVGDVLTVQAQGGAGSYLWSILENASFIGNPTGSTVQLVITGAGRVNLSAQSETCAGGTNIAAVQVDLDIDSKSTRGFDLPSRSPLIDEIEDDPNRTGKLILLNNTDSDGDGIPDFADGFNLLPSEHITVDDTSVLDKFVPIIVQLSGNFGNDTISFVYDDSDPQDVVFGEDHIFRAAPGSLRIWTKSAELQRDARNVHDDGDFVSSNEEYTLSDLGLDNEQATITLWIEAVGPSQQIGGTRISVRAGSCEDAARITVFGTQYVAVGDDNELELLDFPEPTASAPILLPSVLEAGNVRSNTAGDRLLADLVIAGEVDDAIADAFGNWFIDSVFVEVNGERLLLSSGDPITIPVQEAPGPYIPTLARPHDTLGTFISILPAVEVEPGRNDIRILAMNSIGQCGWADRSFVVQLDSPSVQIIIDGFDNPNPYLSSELQMTLSINDVDQDPVILTAFTRVGLFENIDGSISIDLLASEFNPDPSLPDRIEASVFHTRLGELAIGFDFIETDNDSMVFVGETQNPDEFEFSEDLSLYRLTITEVSPIYSTPQGDFRPMFVEVLGPVEMHNYLQSIRWLFEDVFGDDQSLLFETITLANRVFVRAEGDTKPLLFLAPLRIFNNSQISLDVEFGYIPPPDVSKYLRGVGRGLLASGVSLATELGTMIQGVWHLAINYNQNSILYRLTTGDNFILESDQERLRMTWSTATALGEAAWSFLQIGGAFTDELIFGDSEALIGKAPQMVALGFIAMELFEAIDKFWEEFDTYSEEQVGYWCGRIVGELIIVTAELTLTGGAATAHKVATLERLGEKLNGPDLDGFPPELTEAVKEAIQQTITTLRGVKSCFVAGTLVATMQGATAIENIRIGDYVLSQSEATHDTGYKPVVETVTTHPDTLYHLTYCVEAVPDEAFATSSFELTCTGEHPFWVVDLSAFVPANELTIGDQFYTPEVGTIAKLTDIRVERAPLGETFTTYNFAVADWQTYFVGEPGAWVWVHNRGDACVQAFQLIEKVVEQNPGIRHWDAFIDVMERTNSPARKKTFDSVIEQVVESLSNSMFREAELPDGSFDLANLKSVKYWDSFRHNESHPFNHFGKRLIGTDLEAHHIFPQQWAKVLYKQVNGVEPTQSWLDDMPGHMINEFQHRHHLVNEDAGITAFHKILKDILDDGTTDRAEIFTKIQQAYELWDPDEGPRIGRAAIQWIESQGL